MKNLYYTHKFKAKYPVIILVSLMLLIAGFGRLSKLLEIKTVEAQEIIQQVQPLKSELDKTKEENAKLKEKLQTKIEVEEKIKASPEVKARTLKAVAEKWGYEQVHAFEELINKESHFNLFALNKSSGACGMFQALPCSKLPALDLESQIKWGLNYIQNRYGKPSEALAFHIQKGWY